MRARRRPLGGVAHGLSAARELLRLAGAVLRHQIDLVLAAGVGDERNPAPVRRPARPLVVRRRAARQVAYRPVLDRRREDVAARHDQRPLPLRAELRVLDQLRRGDARRAHRQAVVRHGDRDRPRRAVVYRIDLQLAVELVDDPAGAVVGRPADVPGFAVGELRDLARSQVVRVQVERPRPVRGEVDAVADPHRIPIGPPVRRHPLHRVGLAVEDVQLLRPAPLVPLPRPEVPEQRRVDHPRPVRRQVAGARFGHGQRHGQAARGGGQEQPAVGKIGAVAQRAEQDGPAVGRPVVHLVVVAPARGERAARRVVGQLARHAARGGDDVHLLVAVVTGP